MNYVDDLGIFNIVVKNGVDVVLTGNDERAVLAQSGTCRNQMSADDILLHTLKSVDLAVDGGACVR